MGEALRSYFGDPLRGASGPGGTPPRLPGVSPLLFCFSLLGSEKASEFHLVGFDGTWVWLWVVLPFVKLYPSALARSPSLPCCSKFCETSTSTRSFWRSWTKSRNTSSFTRWGKSRSGDGTKASGNAKKEKLAWRRQGDFNRVRWAGVCFFLSLLSINHSFTGYKIVYRLHSVLLAHDFNEYKGGK